MKEVTIRIYSGDDASVIKAIENHGPINFFDLLIDGEVYSNMDHLSLDISVPKRDRFGVLDLDQAKVSIIFNKVI